MIEVTKVKNLLQREFEMKDLGNARRILGMDITREPGGGVLYLSQRHYVNKVLSRFYMHQSSEVSTPLGQHIKLSLDQCPKTEKEVADMERISYASAVGSLMYSMVCCRPDLAHSMSVVSRYMSCAGKAHWEAVKWIMRYMKRTANHGLKFEANSNANTDALVGYVDSDFAANLDSRKSLTGYIFTLYGTAISWKSVQQPIIALSTTEAEFIALTEAVKEAIWLKGIIKEFGIDQDMVVVYCDSQSAIHLVKHQMFH